MDDAGETVVLVPVKAFRDAKARLAAIFDPPTRARFARWTAERVMAAAGQLPIFVACDDDEVAAWANGHGATVLWHPGEGLNPAVNASIGQLRERGVTQVIVAHGDLPRPSPLAAIVTPGVLTLVPDRHDDGTNVAVVPTRVDFELSYGAGSFHRHLDAARAAGIVVEVRRDELLGIDVDTPADLALPLVLEVLPPWLPMNRDNRLSSVPPPRSTPRPGDD